MADEQQVKVAALIAKAVYECIAEFPMGAPSGLIYAALQTKGCTYAQYDTLIKALMKIGWIEQKGDLLYAIPEDKRKEILSP